tara:strand:- start:1513 stop:1959 length:447 start_codon:yes stop_codon:yes gene_type:complete
MILKEEITLNKDIKTVWNSLNSVKILKECIPGCQEIKGNIQTGLEAIVKQKIGPMSVKFTGSIIIKDIVDCESYVIEGKGKGGTAGFANGVASVRLLSNKTNETTIFYSVEAKIGGKIAQLGNRIIGGFAKKMAKNFFQEFKNQLEKN